MFTVCRKTTQCYIDKQCRAGVNILVNHNGNGSSKQYKPVGSELKVDHNGNGSSKQYKPCIGSELIVDLY